MSFHRSPGHFAVFYPILIVLGVGWSWFFLSPVSFLGLWGPFKGPFQLLSSSPTSVFQLSWKIFCPVGWGCRIHWLHLCRGVRLPHVGGVLPLYRDATEDCLASYSGHMLCPEYDAKQSSVMLELWGMWSTIPLPLLPGPFWPGLVAPDKVLSMGQIELFDIPGWPGFNPRSSHTKDSNYGTWCRLS